MADHGKKKHSTSHVLTPDQEAEAMKDAGMKKKARRKNLKSGKQKVESISDIEEMSKHEDDD